jgi:hypothetical protein
MDRKSLSKSVVYQGLLPGEPTMMHQADECSDLPSNVPSRPFPKSIITPNHRHRVVTLRRCSHARSNTPTAGHHSADRDHDAEVLNILQRVLNTLGAS